MRKLTIIAIAAGLMLSAGAADAADCGKLQIVNIVHMTRTRGSDLVPVSLNGVTKNFIFDTGGYFTQVGRPVAEELKLPIRQGRIQMFDMAGNISRDQASVHDYLFGHMHGTDLDFPVSPVPLPIDGIFALDRIYSFDVDVDFGTDTLNLFDANHCAGQVVYWTSPASVAIVPIAMDGFHMVVPVLLDGHEERAMIDTGATRTSIYADEEKRVFNLELGDADTPENGVVNGDQTLKAYEHQFKTLSFGDISVNNPQVRIIPNAMGRNADKEQLVGDRTKSEKDLISTQDMIIGMDVLRKLHIYMAFGERKMYISNASTPQPAAATAATGQ